MEDTEQKEIKETVQSSETVENPFGEDYKETKADFWEYKNSGDKIQGVFLGLETNTDPEISDVVLIDNGNGIKSFWSSMVLSNQLRTITVGDEVGILYLGKKEKEKGKGKSYHNWKVFKK